MKRLVRLVSLVFALVLTIVSVQGVRAMTPYLWNEHLGDVDRDGDLDTTDARLVLQHAVGSGERSYRAYVRVGDADLDGDVDTTDARLILQYAVGKINYQNRKLGTEIPWAYYEDGTSEPNVDALKRS